MSQNGSHFLRSRKDKPAKNDQKVQVRSIEKFRIWISTKQRASNEMTAQIVIQKPVCGTKCGSKYKTKPQMLLFEDSEVLQCIVFYTVTRSNRCFCEARYPRMEYSTGSKSHDIKCPNFRLSTTKSRQ